MKTEILKIDSNSPEASKIEKAVQVLRQGEIIGIPTETVYGLAVDADNREAVMQLSDIKKRPKDKPFTIQIADLSQLRDYIGNIPPKLKLILQEFWPGPLTIIVNGKKGKVGLRIPDNKVALSIIRKANIPLAVTSANISGQISAVLPKTAFDTFSNSVALIIDDGSKPDAVESTILNCTELPFKILRRGSIADRLEELLK